jgi:hypothetical protein
MMHWARLERRVPRARCTRRRQAQRVGAALALAIALGFAPGGLAAQESPSVRARLSGVVFDSLAMRPLARAVVQLVSAREATQARSVETGENGAFAFDSVQAGTYLLGFYHALIDSLGITPPLVRVDVRTSGDLRAPLAVPSAFTLRTALCGPRAISDSLGVFVGFVRSAVDGLTRPKSTVKVQWSEITIGGEGIQRVTPSVQGETSEVGGVAICGVPMGGTVMLHAWNATDSSGFAELEVPSTGLLRRDLFVGPSRAVSLRDSTADSTGITTTVLRGNGVLRGVVRRPDGEPLEGARLTFWGSGVEVATTSTGAYRMQELPAGTYTMEARALGFLPQRHAIDIMEGNETVTDLRLESFGTYLDTVKVTARRVFASREMRDFEERRKRGFGTFLDEDDIEKRNPFFMADLLRMTPGVQVIPGQFGSRILMRGMGFSAFCYPAVFIDGMKVMNVDGDIDAFVNVQEIRAMEVYPRGGSVPVQFQTLDGCGSLVIWTGGRRPKYEAPKKK